MQAISIGHAGILIRTRGITIVCDPWFEPAFFASWFVFPRNDRLDLAPFLTPDYLYISHLHHDHFDPAWLAAHVDKGTQVLLPAFRIDNLERELRALGFERIIHTDHAERSALTSSDPSVASTAAASRASSSPTRMYTVAALMK